MATDSTHLETGATSVEADSDMAGGQDFGSVQLAAAKNDAQVEVNIPKGQEIVRVRVAPGQTIELPTDQVVGLLAKFGPEGNLAIVVDGRTIILQGYAAANDEAPVKIVTNDGDTIDVAELIANTDPGLDITTAAGPAAGAQGNTTPGGGIYTAFGPGAFLGGLNAVGVLDPTALQYRLIDNKAKLFDIDEEENGSPSVFANPDAQLDDDDVPGANGIAGGTGDDDAPLNFSGVLGHDYGSDGPGSLLLLASGNLPAGFTAHLTHGGTVLVISQGGTDVLKITLTDKVSGEYTVEQLAPIHHPNGDDENNLVFTVSYQVTDGNGDTATGSLKINVDDDSPTLVVDAEGGEGLSVLTTELDETVGTDRAAPGETADGNTDDAGPGLGQSTTNVTGGLTALFSIGGGYGADGAGSTTGALSFVGIPAGGLLTTLEATDGGAITLFAASDTLIEGKDTNGDVVFTIAIVDVGGVPQLQTTLFEALEHPDTELFDESVTLRLDEGLVQLQYEVTRIDSDGDPVTKSATIDLASEETSYFHFDDDGPTQTVEVAGETSGNLFVNLDESVGDDRYASGESNDGGPNDEPPALAQATTDIPGGLTTLFSANGDFGSDGAGTVTDDLHFSDIPDGGLPTNLVATDGGAITLFADGDQIIQGKDATGDVVFEIEIVESGGVFQLQTTLFEALVHGDNELFDEAVNLLTTQGGVQLVYEVTRTDGDGDTISDSASIPLITNEGSYFSFDDDGPTLTVGESEQGTGGLAVELDETEGTDRAADGETADGNTDDAGPGLGQKTTTVPGGLVALFALGGDFGSDGAGKDEGSLSFTGIPPEGLSTNLEATDGGAITLFAASDTLIEGKDTDGHVVFKIEIVESGGEFQLQTTLNEALVHGNNALFDETVQLLTTEGGVQLEYEVTRTDGDGDKITDSASIDLITDESSYFNFDDDGPTLTVEESEQGTGGLAIELDETVGTDRAAEGETADGNTDDAGPGLGQKTTTVPGGLVALFSVGGDSGSDGPGGKDSGSLSFTGIPPEGLATNLEATDGGEITLFATSDTLIEGKDATGDVVFTIEIVESGGEFQLQTTLNEALVHGDNDLFDETVQLLTKDGGVQLEYEVTRTDGDGDPITKSATIDLVTENSSYFNFDDDGPTVGTATSCGTFFLQVDETVDGKGGGDVDANGSFPNDGFAPEGDEVINAAAVAAVNLDDLGTVIGAATSSVADLFSGDAGQDGEQSHSYGLEILNGGLTTLKDVQTGSLIQLIEEGGFVKGVVQGTDTVVFALHINEDTGAVTMAQYRAVDHGSDDPSSFPDEMIALGSDVLQATYSLTDKDGDTATTGVDVGNSITFDDDGPTAVNDKDSVTEEDSLIATGNVIDGKDGGLGTDDNDTDGVADSVGSDGLKSITWDDAVANVIDTTYGKLTVDANGNYIYELDNDSKAVQDLKEGQTVDEVFTYTIEDKDGDKSTATLTITITGTNDGPSIDLTKEAVVSDEGLTGGLKDSNPVPDDDTDSKTFVGSITVSDPDGDALTVKMIDTGNFPNWTFGGFAIDWALSPDGLTLTGTANGSPALTVEIASTGVDTYSYTVTLHQPLDHPETNDPDTPATETSFEDELSFPITVEVSDGSTTSQATFTVEVEDDSPVVGPSGCGTFLVQLDETVDGKGGVDVDANGAFPLDGNAAEGDEFLNAAAVALVNLDDLGTVIGAGTSSVAGLFSGQPGADGEGSHSYDLEILNGGLTTLKDSATGNLIQLIEEGGFIKGVVQGTSTLVFAIHINETTGAVTMAQYRAVDHGSDAPNSYPDEMIPLGANVLQVTYSLTDKDGDKGSHSIDLGNSITFDDDGPAIDVTATNESNILLNTQDAETIGAASDTATSTADFSGVFKIGSSSYGADGAGTTSDLDYDLGFAAGFAEGDASGLKIGGVAINLYQDASGVIIGSTAGAEGDIKADNTVFTVSVDADGKVTLTQLQQVDHGKAETSATYDDDEISLPNGKLTLTATGTITDKDGDSATDSATIDLGGNLVFDDDGPAIDVKATGEANIFLNTQDAETIGAASDTATSTADFSGVFKIDSSSFGADGAGTVSDLDYDLGFAAGFKEGDASGLKIGGVAINLYQDASGVIIGSTAGAEGDIKADNTVFTVAVDADGKVTLTQLQQIDHGKAETSATYDDDEISLPNGKLTLTATGTITDKDGDSATDSATIDLGGNLVFDDDGPSIDVTAANEAGVILDTQDAETIGAKSDTDVSTADFSSVFKIGSSSYGADGAGTTTDLDYDLGFAAGFKEGDNSGLTIGGVAIKLYQDASGVIIGSTAGAEGDIKADNTVFTVAVDADGKVTLTQLQQIDHGKAETSPTYDDDQVFLADGKLTLTASATITDKDGDSATDTATIDLGGNLRFDDDGPKAYDPEDTIIRDLAGATIVGDLDIATHTGADGFGKIEFTDFKDGDKATAADGTTVLTSGGNTIYLFGAGTEHLYGSTDPTGKDGTKTVFTADLDGVNDNYTFHLVGTIDNGSGIVFDDFTGTSAGKDVWVGVINPSVKGAPADDDDRDLLLTGIGVNSVNTDSDSIGVGNQSITAGRGLRVDFVNNVTGTQDTDKAWNYTDAIDTTSASFKIAQTNPNGADAVVRIRAVDETGVDIHNFADDTQVNLAISTITVIRGTTTYGPGTNPPHALSEIGITVYAMSDGTVVVDGLVVGDECIVSSGTAYNRLEITNVDGLDVDETVGGKNIVTGGNFDIGAVSILTSNVGDPIDVNLHTKLTDGDGDSITGIINVQIDPASDAVVSNAGTAANETIAGGSGNDMLGGADGNDVINASFGNDSITGGTGNDTINGGGGNDTIDGGAGNDSILAGDGDDRVKYDSADGKVDGGTSADNNLEHAGNLGDVLDVSGTVSLNLNTAGAGTKLVGFETLDMAGGGANSVTLAPADVISLGSGTFNPEGDLGVAGSKDAVKIVGDVGDSVTLTGGGWFDVTSQVSDPPVGFKVYAHDTDATAGLQPATINAYVLVENEVTVATP